MGEIEQALNERINGHRSDIVNKKIDDKPVAAHFNSPQHTLEDLQVMVIEQLWKRHSSKEDQRKQVDYLTPDLSTFRDQSETRQIVMSYPLHPRMLAHSHHI